MSENNELGDFLSLQNKIGLNEKGIEHLTREFYRLSAKFDLAEKNSREFDGMMLLKMDHNDFYRKLTIGIATGAIVVSLVSLMGMVIYVSF